MARGAAPTASLFVDLKEFQLARPPLVSVVAQVQFPPVASIAKQDFIAPFQEKLREEYPILRGEREVGIVVGPGGAAAAPNSGGGVWRFTSPLHPWRISLAPAFVAVDTTKYTTRTDFLRRLGTAMDALSALITPAVFDRLGVRYTNRLESADELQRLPELVRPELLTILPVVGSEPGVKIAHSLSETVLVFEDASLLLRWGLLPPDTALDPSVEPASTQSWLLDLDMFVQKSSAFDRDLILNMAASFAARTYAFFRWAVTDTLLRERAK